MISFYGLGKNDLAAAQPNAELGCDAVYPALLPVSALSGQLSNKFDKAVLARWIKLLEIIIMAVAAYGFYIQSAPLLLICLFCMGTQSTLFGPLKYAILPDYLNDKELIMGNSLIESGTFIAILLGQILGHRSRRCSAVYCWRFGVIGRYWRHDDQPVYAVCTR